MVWNKARIIQELRKLWRGKVDISYNALARRHQALVSAAAYHFGSYRRAVEKADIPYADVLRRPRWTKQRIIQQIKKGKRAGHDLHWSAVTKRRDELGKAAFASLQPRLFGRWDRALHAAGLDADEISMYRSWDPQTVIYELKARAREGEPLNSGALQQDDPGLHAAAVRHFGGYDQALRAAHLNPERYRRRRTWTKEDVLAAIRKEKRQGKHLADSLVRRSNPALHGAAVRLFGSFPKARTAAGVAWQRRKPKRRKK